MEFKMDYPIKCYDNKGESIDRYTILFMLKKEGANHNEALSLSMSSDPNHPCGVCMWTIAEDGMHLGDRIDFEQLPTDCRAIVHKEFAYGDDYHE